MARSDIAELKSQIENAASRLDISSKESQLAELTEQSRLPDFWTNNEAASSIMQEISILGSQIEPWKQLLKEISDIAEISEMNDQSLNDEIDAQLHATQKKFDELKKELRFTGQFDTKNAILSIYAGAGGTDAQDWAGMLLRMYTRWAEKNGFKAAVLDESAGEEAGLKSVQIEVSGPFAYGKLRSEHGVHRLVRLSPFNADAKRQTSFAKVEILPKIDAPEDVPLDETDLKIDVFRAGGHGGQSVNTTDSAVRVTHIPTGIVVSIQNERSQLQNKETALTILRSKLAQLREEQHKEAISELKGPNQSAEWGNQIRSYVLHPYTMVKDLRTRHETTDVQGVLGGDLDSFIDAYLEENMK